MNYAFISNGSSTIFTLIDLDAGNDDHYTAAFGPRVITYATCGASNCTTSRTIALNATYGHYFFNISNPGTTPVAAALNYTLYPANSSGTLLWNSSLCMHIKVLLEVFSSEGVVGHVESHMWRIGDINDADWNGSLQHAQP